MKTPLGVFFFRPGIAYCCFCLVIFAEDTTTKVNIMSDLKFNAEQTAVIESDGQVVKVTAGAGCGKTSTLVGLSKFRPKERLLYVCFNKAIQIEAAGKFPENVTSRTAHSIAYGAFGHKFANTPNKLAGDIKPFHIQRHLQRSLASIPMAAGNLYGGRVIETVKNFMVSSDKEMTLRNVSVGKAPVEVKHFDEKMILADAKAIWAQMQDLKSEVPMLHDGYLKLYQLSDRRLPFDRILFDEAQDTNPVTQAIVEAQSARKVYVGDRHQAIYGFRGATNAMEQIEADAHFSLTGSYRFGQEVADIANSILAVKNETMRLRGLGAPSKIRPIAASEGYAFISRGNVAIFNRAVQCLTKEEPFSFVGEIKGYRFDQILDVFNLSIGAQVKDPFIRSFEGFDQLAEYAELINDREVKSRIKVVTKYGSEIPSLLDRIEKRALPPVTSANPSAYEKRIILTTGHKAKGLEMPRVRLAGDFMELIDDEGRMFDVSTASTEQIEEVNLQYVAATRAQHVLQLCESLETYLEHVREFDADAPRRMTV